MQHCTVFMPKPHPHKEKDPSTFVDQTLLPGEGDSEHATLGGEVPVLSPSMIMGSTKVGSRLSVNHFM